jgi:hypothetical protein
MSQEEERQVGVIEPDKVVINDEDLKHIEDFFNHFEIPMHDRLKARIQEFRDDPAGYTVLQQKRLRQEMSHAIVNTDHPLLQDELFSYLRANCAHDDYHAQFDRDIEEALTDEKES